MLLDMNGILFAVQLVILLVIGPYADYGKWRPWVLIGKRSLEFLFSAHVSIQSQPSCSGSPLWASPV